MCLSSSLINTDCLTPQLGKEYKLLSNIYSPAFHGKRQGSICHDDRWAYRPFLFQYEVSPLFLIIYALVYKILPTIFAYSCHQSLTKFIHFGFFKRRKIMLFPWLRVLGFCIDNSLIHKLYIFCC